MGKKISLKLEDSTYRECEALRKKLGLIYIQDVIRLLIPEGLKQYKEGDKD